MSQVKRKFLDLNEDEIIFINQTTKSLDEVSSSYQNVKSDLNNNLSFSSKTRELNFNNPDIKVDPKTNSLIFSKKLVDDFLMTDLKCPICLGPIIKAVTASPCLHRFCSLCLQRSLRVELGSKSYHDCPSCRAKLPSRRSSKPDSTFDNLIALFTNNESNLLTSQGGFAIEESYKRKKVSEQQQELDPNFDYKIFQEMHKKKVEEFRAKMQNSSNSSSNFKRSIINDGTKQKRTYNKAPTTMINVAILPWIEDNDSPSLTYPFLRFPPQILISEIKSFIILRLHLNEKKEVSLFLLNPTTNGLINVNQNDSLTLANLMQTYWNPSTELILIYRFI